MSQINYPSASEILPESQIRGVIFTLESERQFVSQEGVDEKAMNLHFTQFLPSFSLFSREMAAFRSALLFSIALIRFKSIVSLPQWYCSVSIHSMWRRPFATMRGNRERCTSIFPLIVGEITKRKSELLFWTSFRKWHEHFSFFTLSLRLNRRDSMPNEERQSQISSLASIICHH